MSGHRRGGTALNQSLSKSYNLLKVLFRQFFFRDLLLDFYLLIFLVIFLRCEKCFILKRLKYVIEYLPQYCYFLLARKSMQAKDDLLSKFIDFIYFWLMYYFFIIQTGFIFRVNIHFYKYLKKK